MPDHGVQNFLGVGLEHVKIDTEWSVGAFFHIEYTSFDLTRFDGRASEEAETASIARSSRKLRVSHPPHSGLDYRIAAAKLFAENGVE
ncbi:MAG: hypothetical protein Rhirs2KO_10420 [Rhizobiaceae bacterium]